MENHEIEPKHWSSCKYGDFDNGDIICMFENCGNDCVSMLADINETDFVCEFYEHKLGKFNDELR